jgi:hypothetical protein
MTMERKPILKPRPSGKFKMADFQREDIAKLAEDDASANWGEMGTFKTTSAEWLWSQKLAHVPNPRVLVITTKTGKGTYFESLPEVLPEWDVYNIGTDKTTLVIGSRPVPVPVKLPNPLHFRPVVAIAHYHCFTNRACIPQQVKQKVKNPFGEEVEVPVLNEDGTFKMTTPKNQNLLQREWDLVLCDEAHRIKDPDAQWSRNIKKLQTRFKHIMTGTGFVNNPSEIWSLLNFLFPKVYSNRDKFRNYYCDIQIDPYTGYQKIVGVKPGMEDEFRNLVNRVGVRRTMIEVFPDIKEPIETVVPVRLNPTQRKMYDDIAQTLQTMDQKGELLHSPNVLSMLNRLRQICVATPEVVEDYYDPIEERRIIKVRLVEPSSKLNAAMEIIEGLEWDAERKDQVVVFSNFRDPLSLLEKRLERAKIPYMRMLPEHNEQKRYKMWHDIWPSKEHQVFLSTLKLGAESINLSSAHRAIFLDQDWSPVPNKQARGRLYRPGQTGACQFIYIRGEDSVDHYVLEKNVEKDGWFRQIFGRREDAEE